MVTRYKVVHWRFDNENFGRHIKAWVETVGWDAVSECLGVSKSTLHRWIHSTGEGEHDFPSMTNYIKVCDELSLYPSEFFTTNE